MVRDLSPVDITTMPDLVRLAREVAETGTPRMLREHGADLAILAPAPARRRPRKQPITQADIEAALAVAGAWKDWMDPEEFKRERRELQVHDRPDREP